MRARYASQWPLPLSTTAHAVRHCPRCPPSLLTLHSLPSLHFTPLHTAHAHSSHSFRLLFPPPVPASLAPSLPPLQHFLLLSIPPSLPPFVPPLPPFLLPSLGPLPSLLSLLLQPCPPSDTANILAALRRLTRSETQTSRPPARTPPTAAAIHSHRSSSVLLPCGWPAALAAAVAHARGRPSHHCQARMTAAPGGVHAAHRGPEPAPRSAHAHGGGRGSYIHCSGQGRRTSGAVAAHDHESARSAAWYRLPLT